MKEISLKLLIIFFFLNAACRNEDGERSSFSISSVPPVTGIRLAWDYTTRKQLSPASPNYSGYARMIKLDNGKLFCVYESEGAIHNITSTDLGKTWSDPVIIAHPENGIACAVPDVLQLQDRSILVSYNMRPPGNNAEVSKRFSIRVKKSMDGGSTWSDHKQIYTAGHEFKNGCWEPSQIQLPSGEIQLYIANEGPYTQTNEQEITMFRSADNGVTWTEGETVSFRKGYRDGMPVPLFLQDQQIVFAIEDNGIDRPEFKPAIVRTSLDDNWRNAPVLAESADREYALSNNSKIAPAKYAGAPYIRQLPSGEVILSYQGNERRPDNQWDRSDMIVCIGDEHARDFNRKSIPFYNPDITKTCLWNSLAVADENTVIALGSTNAYSSKTGVWMIKGYVLPKIRSQKESIAVDGNGSEAIWQSDMPVFIGGYGPSQVSINTAWDDNMLYVIALVNDEAVFASGDPAKDDGIQLFIDAKNHSTTVPVSGIYSVLLSAEGKVYFKEGDEGVWKDREPEGILSKVKQTDKGYSIETGIPWSVLGGLPEPNKRIGFHACLFENSTGVKHDYIEPLSGNINDAPYSWSPMFLTN